MLDIKDYWYFYEWKRLWLKCKSCMLEWRKTEYERSMARKRDRDRYYNNLKRREYVFKTALERRKEKWYWHIHTKTEKMIKKLWMRPNYCPICWKENRIIAHHPDYSKWYEIVFCCQPCHAKIHKWELEVFNIKRHKKSICYLKNCFVKFNVTEIASDNNIKDGGLINKVNINH